MTYARVIVGTMLASMVVCCVSEDAVPVHLKTGFRLGCVTGICLTSGKLPREIDALDGDEGYVLNCEVGDGATAVTFRAISTAAGERFAIELENIGSRCLLRVEDGNSAFEKDCEVVSGTPSCEASDDVTAPCQVKIRRDGTAATGSFCCSYIPLENRQPQETDYFLVAPLSNGAASFEVENCIE